MTQGSATFLDGLSPAARELLLAAARPVSFVVGATLVRHGDPARGAFVLREGAVEARVTAPGGEALVVARLGGGDIFGEMALVEAGTCSATVVAVEPVDGWFLAQEDFRAVVAQRTAAAGELQHAVTLGLATRLRALNERLAAVDAPEDRPARSRAGAGQDALAAAGRLRRASFELPAFLGRLAFFEHFPPEEAEEVMALARVLELPRGAPIHAPGGPAKAVFVVARGAVEIVRPVDGCERRVAVLGPGSPFGFLGALLDSPHGTWSFAREASTLIEISAEAFRALYFGDGAVSVRIRAAVQRSLLESLARTNRALTRLSTHARLAARAAQAADLEAAGAAELWKAADATVR